MKIQLTDSQVVDIICSIERDLEGMNYPRVEARLNNILKKLREARKVQK